MLSLFTCVVVSSTLLATAPQTGVGWITRPHPERFLVLVDTRTYRHCHNKRGKYAVCFKKDPRDPPRPVSEQAGRRDPDHLQSHQHHEGHFCVLLPRAGGCSVWPTISFAASCRGALYRELFLLSLRGR